MGASSQRRKVAQRRTSKMSNDYSPDADDQMPEKKSSQQLLLLLLLLLVVLFGYLYFFTGLIKPRGEQPKPQPVAEAPVKSPLPPRPEAKGAQPAQPAAPAAAQVEEHKAAAPPAHPAPPGAPAKEAAAAKLAAGKEAAAPKPSQVATVKPAAPAPPAKQAVQATVAHPAAPPATEAKPAAAAKNTTPQPGGRAKLAEKPAGEKQQAVAKQPAAVKPPVAAQKPALEKSATAAATKTKAPAKVATPRFTLEINGDLAESEIAPVLAKLKQAGVGNVIKSKTSKGEPMHRLFLADFANHDEAAEELERLKLAAPSAFLLKENGRYAVYAGSYLREVKATTEQNRLQAKGVQLLLKNVTAPVAVYKVRAGAFADQAGADRAAKAAQKAGLSPKVVKIAKAGK